VNKAAVVAVWSEGILATRWQSLAFSEIQTDRETHIDSDIEVYE
jgi:hypothetical protein